MKQSFDRVNQLGEELNNLDVELATKGVSTQFQKQMLEGEIPPDKYSWQDMKSHLDRNEWDDDQGERMADEILKVIKNRWEAKQMEQRLNTQMGGFVENMNPEQARVLQEQGVDPNYILQQMNLTPGDMTTTQYSAGYSQGQGHWGSASPINRQGLTSTAYYGAPQGGRSFQDVLGQYLTPAQAPTTAQTMTDQQRQQLRALQQLATVSGGKFESKV